MPTPLSLLRRPFTVRPFTILWAAALVSKVGDWIARVALTVVVLARTHSPALAGLTVALSLLPWVGAGQFIATRLDRLPRKAVLVTSNLMQAAVFALLALPLPIPLLLAGVLAAALAVPAFSAARSSLLVAVVPADIYPAALGVASMSDSACLIVGYLVGGVGVAALGGTAALLVNSASFVVSAALIAGIHEPARDEDPARRRARVSDGIRVLRADRLLWRVAWLSTSTALPSMAVEASAAAYAHLALHASAKMVGLLAVSAAGGQLAGDFISPRAGEASRLVRASAIMGSAGAMAGVAGFLAGGTVGALVGFAGAGMVAALLTPGQAAVGPRIPEHSRAATFSILQGALAVAQALGAVVGGLLISLAGPRVGLATLLGLALALSTAAWLYPAADVGPPDGLVSTGTAGP